jgi:Bacterial regulatory proteins, tetR family/AefR-like transcriptional repressor, C-terminal domain
VTTNPSNKREPSRNTRQVVLDAALETFIELGYQGTSMAHVAEKAGVIKQTIYRYFDNKEALFREIITCSTVDVVKNELKAVSNQKLSTQAKLRKVAETIMGRHKNPQFTKLIRTIIAESGRFPELGQLFSSATIKPGLDLIVHILGEDPTYKIPDPEAFARVFIGSIVNFCTHQYLLRGSEYLPFDQERLIVELLRLVEMQRVGA